MLFHYRGTIWSGVTSKAEEDNVSLTFRNCTSVSMRPWNKLCGSTESKDFVGFKVLDRKLLCDVIGGLMVIAEACHRRAVWHRNSSVDTQIALYCRLTACGWAEKHTRQVFNKEEQAYGAVVRWLAGQLKNPNSNNSKKGKTKQKETKWSWEETPGNKAAKLKHEEPGDGRRSLNSGEMHEEGAEHHRRQGNQTETGSKERETHKEIYKKSIKSSQIPKDKFKVHTWE